MSSRFSVFEAEGFAKTIQRHLDDIKDLFLEDDVPWIVGYSGGKDSTAVLQLIWMALEQLPSSSLNKQVHVISTDTLVENPIVSAWVANSHEVMQKTARKTGLPFVSHKLTPEVANTFWVNLIGKGYPAPRPKFRWCTERLKIRPSNQFIIDVTNKSGKSVLVLGARKAESSTRAATMARHEKHRTRDKLSPSGSLPGCNIYTPIEIWTNDDVWLFLMQAKNPWGFNNQDLLNMYQGASADGECPLVVDTSTPSCGDSRFGCWVCTLVEQDKSMTAMIQNDAEKDWMLPLLNIRNSLDFRLMGKDGASEDTEGLSDRKLRDFRRMNGNVQFMGEGENRRVIPGPYTQEARKNWLKMLLDAQSYIQSTGPKEVRDIELVTIRELEEIRRIWVFEKGEIEDFLPIIYQSSLGKKYPGKALGVNTFFDLTDLNSLKQICIDKDATYELCRDILTVISKRIFSSGKGQTQDDLVNVLNRYLFASEKEAMDQERLVLNQNHEYSKPRENIIVV